MTFRLTSKIFNFTSKTIRNINVSKIKCMTYHKRLFMIYNRDYPYVLHIEYKEPTSRVNNQLLTVGIPYWDEYPTTTYKPYYKTEESVRTEMCNIIREIEKHDEIKYDKNLLKGKLYSYEKE